MLKRVLLIFCLTITSSFANDMMHLTINNQRFDVILSDTKAAKALVKQLPLTLSMTDLHRNEKYAQLTFSLPQNASVPSMIQAGDVMLFGSDCLVLFYETFSTSYRYTPTGTISNITSLKAALGTQDVEISFEP